MNTNARAIAYYLPQFHPVPTNDKYWGKGFTEWTNVAKAKPLFRGHYQPRIPADLGFYDLRREEVRIQQAELAKQAGIEGFCYWHYWFRDGVEVLEKPLDWLVESGKPDFPFCVGWANHDWSTKTWDNIKKNELDSIIFKQEYLGKEDNEKHFYRLLPAFKDRRYISVDGKLLFVIFDPLAFVGINDFIIQWNDLAHENGLKGFHFVGVLDSLPQLSVSNISQLQKIADDRIEKVMALGFDAINLRNQKAAEVMANGKMYKAIFGALRRSRNMPLVEKYNYTKVMKHYYSDCDLREDIYPQILVGWDRSPRSGKKAIVYDNSTPEAFKKAARMAIDRIINKAPEHRIVFLNSWNEWGEGAYMEPDTKYGHGFIDALREVLTEERV